MLVVDIKKMCMWVFLISFERITAFQTFVLGNFCIVGYGDCVINCSYKFQRTFFELCTFVVNIMIMCMWSFNGPRINFEKITAFRT